MEPALSTQEAGAAGRWISGAEIAAKGSQFAVALRDDKGRGRRIRQVSGTQNLADRGNHPALSGPGRQAIARRRGPRSPGSDSPLPPPSRTDTTLETPGSCMVTP